MYKDSVQRSRERRAARRESRRLTEHDNELTVAAWAQLWPARWLLERPRLALALLLLGAAMTVATLALG